MVVRLITYSDQINQLICTKTCHKSGSRACAGAAATAGRAAAATAAHAASPTATQRTWARAASSAAYSGMAHIS